MQSGLALLAVFAAALAGCAASPPEQHTGALVFGGTGRTGSLIVRELLNEGRPVTVFARPTSDRTRLSGLDVAYIVGDALEAQSVNSAVAESRPAVIVNAIGGRRNQTGFWDVTQMNMTRAGRAHGVKEIVFLSSQGVGDSASAYTPEALERSKASLDERFRAEEDLKVSGLDFVIVRTGIVAPENLAPTGRAVLTQNRSVLSAVTRADLAKRVVGCIENRSCRNQTLAAKDDGIDVANLRRQ